jgi:pimeloyl-ACP methyl ester carboxylesterase
MIRIIFASIMAAASLLSFDAASAPPQQPVVKPTDKSLTREEVTSILRENRKIVSDHGVEESTTIKIGGIMQAISIRGRDTRNPILLVVLPQLAAFNFDNVTSFRCPIFLFTGRHDLSVSHEVAAQWYEKLHAPKKELVWFENSAHLPMLEEPGRFLLHLVTDVRPIAVRAGDTAPDDKVLTQSDAAAP